MNVEKKVFVSSGEKIHPDWVRILQSLPDDSRVLSYVWGVKNFEVPEMISSTRADRDKYYERLRQNIEWYIRHHFNVYPEKPEYQVAAARAELTPAQIFTLEKEPFISHICPIEIVSPPLQFPGL